MPHALTDIQKIILVILNASEYKKLIFLRGNLISRTSNSVETDCIIDVKFQKEPEGIHPA
jgi:hypothetical protein